MRRLLSWAVFALVVFLAWQFLAPVNLGGEVSYVKVDGTSMEPTYRDGDLVITRASDNYGPGDVIAYDAPVEVGFPVIHRIIDRQPDGFVTQGDNRDEADGWLAPREHIHGSAWVHIPRGAVFLDWLATPSAIMSILAGWFTFSYLSRQERKRKDEPEEPGEPDSDSTAAPALGGPSLAGVALAACLALAAAAGATAGEAHASDLLVDGGILQSWSIDDPSACGSEPRPPCGGPS